MENFGQLLPTQSFFDVKLFQYLICFDVETSSLQSLADFNGIFTIKLEIMLFLILKMQKYTFS